jgi:hypothetical protein
VTDKDWGPQRIYVSHPHGTKTYSDIVRIDMEGPLRLYSDDGLVAAYRDRGWDPNEVVA